MTLRTAACLLVLLALAACGPRTDAGDLGERPDPGRDPRALGGHWQVEGDGVASGTVLVLGEDLSVDLPCGTLRGAWEAEGEQGLFLASVDSGDRACFPASGREPLPWLEGARSVTVDAERRVLRGPRGEVLAVLRPTAASSEGASPSRDVPAPVAPLPDGVSAATAEQLVRRWVPVGVEGTPAHLQLRADGTWTGSDGCNGQSGTWALGEEGRLLGTAGAQTLIACEGAPVGGWVDAAARAGLLDGDLVLHDAAGARLGRLAPA